MQRRKITFKSQRLIIPSKSVFYLCRVLSEITS